LDELDREEFVRLKKVKGFKEKAAAEEEEERKKKALKEKAKEDGVANGVQSGESKNILGDDGDEDVIF
jgi:V-type H+-transporting ATPase subunit D